MDTFRLSIAAVGAVIMLPFWVRAASASDTLVGTYQLADGRILDITPSDGDTLRWRRFDGATGGLHKDAHGNWTGSYGWTDRADRTKVSLTGRSTGEIRVDDVLGKRIAFDVIETRFESHGAILSGRLVMPKGDGGVPVVVLLHGAENDSALSFYTLQRLLPAQGVGAFVYDKRGTGISGGSYTQDFDLLADDAVAAMCQARGLAGSRLSRIGYQAGSQGGWVAPLAAKRAPVDFVIVCFGLAVTVIEEDREEVALEMRLKGHSPEEIAKALEVATAAENVAVSGFTKGFAEFDAVRTKYKREPWYKDLHGNYTWFLLPYSEAELRKIDNPLKHGTPFHYDPMPTLRASTTPQLWILGEDDLDAPSMETSRRIKTLIAEGLPFTLAVCPGAEHGMTEYEIGPHGERVSTRFAPGYFEMIRDFARDGRLSGKYGRSTITSRSSR